MSEHESNEALPLHNKRYVIIYERMLYKVEVISVDDERMAHAIFDAIIAQVKLQLNGIRSYHGKLFGFSLHMWRCPGTEPQPCRWTIQMGKAIRHKHLVPVQVQAVSGQYPLRGYDLEQFLGID